MPSSKFIVLSVSRPSFCIAIRSDVPLSAVRSMGQIRLFRVKENCEIGSSLTTKYRLLLVTDVTVMEMCGMCVFFYHEENISIFRKLSFPEYSINNILKSVERKDCVILN